MPTLTIGLPIYNEEKYIAETLEDLLAQTYKDFVVLISDNASTDKTRQICESYARKDSRIIYVRQPENRGMFFNFRYVLEQAKTPYFMWCGGHDKLHPRFIEKLLPAVGKDNVVLSCCKTGVVSFFGEIRDVKKNDNHDTTATENPKDRFFYLLKFNNLGYSYCGIYLTEVLKKCNIDFETYGPDVVILQELSLYGKFKQNKEVLYWWRQNRESESLGDAIKRVFNGKKSGGFSAFLSYMAQLIKISFDKRYSFSMAEKLLVIIRVAYYRFFNWYLTIVPKIILRKLVGTKNYLKLKSAIQTKNLKK